LADRAKQVVVGLAVAQLTDVVAAQLVSPEFIGDHLDHLGVPPALRRLLSPIKATSSAGLLLGLLVPELGAVTAAGLIGYYGIAVGFHLRTHESPISALPAVLLGAAAAAALKKRFLPALAA
jgi:hypothetical protein